MLDKYVFQDEEPTLQTFWEQEKITTFDKETDKPIFSIDTPPPTVSGKIHIGHLFSYTQAEIVARYKRMLGYTLFYPFGFDDNGLPTERLVEKEIGKKGHELSREEFIQECLRVTNTYRGNFKKVWQAMGFSVDRDLSYSTISPEVQKVSQASFIKLAQEGNIYQKNAPGLWCTECQTGIAQAELDKKSLESVFYDIAFNLVDGTPITISTTRLELLPACVAVFVNPDDERYTHLIGKDIITPLGATVQILADEKVDIAKGSGVVMCCSYGDETDMHWIKKHNLPEKIILDKDGKIHSTQSDLDGVYYKKGRKILIEKLQAEGKILKSQNINHDVGVHERCGTPIEILPINQWFVKTVEIKDTLMKLGQEITRNPPHMFKRYAEWVENLKWDWCISRQRYFGIPIPAWRSKKTGELILPDIKDLPVNPLLDKPSYLPEGHTYDDVIPESDVLDTWATSSLTPLVNAKFFSDDSLAEKILPMDLRPQAHDIIRTWAFYTIVMSYYHTGKKPFDNIMISGHVLAGKNEKISKSKGNEKMTPEQLLAKYGADAIRYRAGSGTLGTDTVFDEKEIEKGRKLITKLWNVVRLVTLNLEDFETNNKVNTADLTNIDQWALHAVEQVATSMKKSLESYNTGSAILQFEEFFWSTFCDNYLEIFKGRMLYASEEDKKLAKRALYKATYSLVKLIAPVLPHVAEKIYQDYFKQYEGDKSIHIAQYSSETLSPIPQGDVLDTEVYKLFRVIDDIRREKTNKGIKYGVESDNLTIQGPEDLIAIIKNYTDSIKAIARAKNIVYTLGDTVTVHIA